MPVRMKIVRWDSTEEGEAWDKAGVPALFTSLNYEATKSSYFLLNHSFKEIFSDFVSPM
jgi:hypothetical protein